MGERENWPLSIEHESFQQAPSPFQQQSLSREQHLNNEPLRLRRIEAVRRFGVDVLLAEANVPLMTLQVWEKSYGIPSPWTDEHQQKLYSQRDIAAVRWLREQVVSNMSLCQAIVGLVRQEPTYINHHVSNMLLPPPRELPELRDKLMQAIASMNMANSTHILADAFLMYPAKVVCESLLRPVFAYTVELRKREIIPSATETSVAKLIQSQVPHLIEVCFSPKDASEYLSSLLLQVSRSDEMKQQEKIAHAVPDLDKMEEPLIKTLVQMNQTIALRILDSAFHYYSAEDVCLSLLQPTLSHIRALLATNTISAAVKDFSATLVYKYLSTLFQTTPNLRKGLLLLVCEVSSQEETYEIDGLILALFWRRAGLHVHYHGRLSESRGLLSVLETIRPLHPGIIYLSATKHSRIHDVKEVEREVIRLKQPRPIFCFGGNAFDGNTTLLHGIAGAYLGSSIPTHMQRLNEVIRLSPRYSPDQIEELLSARALATGFQEKSEAASRLGVREEYAGLPKNNALFSMKAPERASTGDATPSGASSREMFPKEETHKLPTISFSESDSPPKNAAIYNEKGNALLARKLYREALEYYERAISLEPQSAAAYNGKGNALSGLGLYKEAEKAYLQAERLTRGPSGGRW